MRALCTWMLGAALMACGGSTGGERFDFEAAAGGIERAETGPLQFVNQLGWSIQLSRADVTIGPIYLNTVAPLRTGAMSFWSRFVPTAQAAGEEHLDGGRIVGEVLGQVQFSALSPALVPFATSGSVTAERVRTTDLWFYPPPGVSPETSKGVPASLSIAGVATRGTETVSFRGALTINDDWLPAATPGSRASKTVMSLRQVRGVASSFLPARGGKLQLRVDVRPMLRGADFSSLSSNKTDADGTRILSQTVGSTDQVMTNLYQGLRTTNGPYEVQWVDSN